jgi:hypothetical protein
MNTSTTREGTVRAALGYPAFRSMLAALAVVAAARRSARGKTMHEPRMFSKIIVMVLLAGVAGARGGPRFGTATKEE